MKIIAIALSAGVGLAATWTLLPAQQPAQPGEKKPAPEIEPVARFDAVLRVIRDRLGAAEDLARANEFDGVVAVAAPMAELAGVQTLRDDPKLRDWAARLRDAALVILRSAEAGDGVGTAAGIKKAKALTVEADKNMPAWRNVKPVRSPYTPAVRNVKLWMTFVSETSNALRKGVRAKSAGRVEADMAWATAELANVLQWAKPDNDWRQWSLQLRDGMVDAARGIEGRMFAAADNGRAAAEATCNGCHNMNRFLPAPKPGKKPGQG
jgi:hypothetical protein